MAPLTLIITVAVAGCSLFPERARPDEQVQFPVTYFADPSEVGDEWEGTEIELRTDGGASLTRYPIGSLDRTEAGTVCLNWDGETLHTGPASWALDDGLRIVVTVDEQESVVSAGSQLMGELNWAYDLGIAFCDGADDLLLSTHDALPYDERP